MENKELFKQITQEVRMEIADLDVAPPLLYSTLFYNLVSEHHLECKDEEHVVDKILDEKLSKLNTLSDNTAHNITKLQKNTTEAITAIEKKDDISLQRISREMKALREEVEVLKRSIFTDTLTKAYNRQWLYANFIDEHESFTCKGYLVFIDMNYFKDINDNYGHIAGDKVLEFTAMHLKTTGAKLVRYGGDEFLLLFGDKRSKESVERLMQNNREEIVKKELRYKESKFHASYSYGLISFELGDNFQDTLAQVDALMYEDKNRFKRIM